MGDSEKVVGSNLIKRFVSIMLLLFSGIYLAFSLSIPVGRLAKPGPGMVPVCIGIFLTILSLLHVIEVFFFEKNLGVQEKGAEALTRADKLRVAGLISILILYIIFFTVLGYTLSTIIMVGVVLYLLGMHGWVRIVLVAIVISIGSYYLFGRFLEVPLPMGSIPFLS